MTQESRRRLRRVDTALNRLTLRVALIALFLLSVAALYWACETWTWRKLFSDLAVGALVSLLFYLLVVSLPDYQRRRRLKRSLQRHYQAFREDSITIMLLVLDDPAGIPETNTLMEPANFKKYFTAKVSSGQTRWHDFQNKLDHQYKYMRSLLSHMEIFRQELHFCLNNIDIPKDNSFEFLKQMSAAIYLMRDVTPGYDESKPLACLLWSMFAGWDSIKGYHKADPIKSILDAI
jgi:hypothetical protein